MIDGPEHDGNSGRRRPVESSLFSFIFVSRGVPRADIILEHASSLWLLSMTSRIPTSIVQLCCAQVGEAAIGLADGRA